MFTTCQTKVRNTVVNLIEREATSYKHIIQNACIQQLKTHNSRQQKKLNDLQTQNDNLKQNNSEKENKLITVQNPMMDMIVIGRCYKQYHNVKYNVQSHWCKI